MYLCKFLCIFDPELYCALTYLCSLKKKGGAEQKHFLCVSHQIKYAGSDTDFSASPAFCKQIRRVEAEEPRVIGTQTPLQALLEGLIADKELPAKDKRKRLKQFQRSYPEVYHSRFPTEESKAAVVPEKTPRLKPHLMFFNLKKPFQPFQRSWSFRA